MRSLLYLIYHPFPKVRGVTSEKLYTALLTLEDYSYIIPGGEDSYEAAIEMISETNWNLKLSEIASGKETLYSFFGLTPNKPVPKEQPAVGKTSTDDDMEMIKT
jgi:hypothetical protein